MPDLTPRQAEMFQLLADGRTYQQIAEQLWISQPTVNTTIRNARIRLGATTVAEALNTAARLGLITTPATTKEQPMSTRYRKKPVIIDAVQWTGDNADQLVAFTDARFTVVAPEDRTDDPDKDAAIHDDLHSTWVLMATGDWVIRGVQGEYYPCRPDVFAATYEPVTG